MEETQALTAFAALSHATRLRMVRALVEAGPEGMPAGELAKSAGASPSRASFHLTALTEAGLVQVHRRARQMVYQVDFAGLGALVGFVIEDCCKNSPAVLACCPPGATRRA